MRLFVVVLSIFIALSLLGCGGKLAISTYPGILLAPAVHTVKVLNGTNYTLEVIEVGVMIEPGGQIKIPYLKSHRSGSVGLSVRAIEYRQDRQVIGVATKTIRIPSFKHSSSNTENTWLVTRLKFIR